MYARQLIAKALTTRTCKLDAFAPAAVEHGPRANQGVADFIGRDRGVASQVGLDRPDDRLGQRLRGSRLLAVASPTEGNERGADLGGGSCKALRPVRGSFPHRIESPILSRSQE